MDMVKSTLNPSVQSILLLMIALRKMLRLSSLTMMKIPFLVRLKDYRLVTEMSKGISLQSHLKVEISRMVM